MPVAPLPDLDTLDATALKDMVIRQHAQISSHDAEVERLRLIIARLRRLQFGRKSEKTHHEIKQLELQLEDLEAGNAEKQEKTERTLAPAAAGCLRLQHASRHAVPCRITFRVKYRFTTRRRKAVRHAAAT